MGGGDARSLQVFRVPGGGAVLRVRSARGTEVFAQERAQVEWARPGIGEAVFDADGSRILTVKRPALGRIELRRSSGTQVVDSRPGEPRARFRVVDPAREGFGPLEVWLLLGDEELLWARLPPSPSAEAVRSRLVQDLAALDVVGEMRAAGRGSAAARRLAEALEERGFVDRFRQVRALLEPLLDAEGPEAVAFLGSVSKLLLLDAYFAGSGIEDGDLLRAEDLARGRAGSSSRSPLTTSSSTTRP